MEVLQQVLHEVHDALALSALPSGGGVVGRLISEHCIVGSRRDIRLSDVLSAWPRVFTHVTVEPPPSTAWPPILQLRSV